jgi:S-adenosylmethionine synthetase
MASRRYLFTSESVSMGHPDKLADQISDAVLDAMLTQDPRSRVACETLVTTGLAVVAGEVTCDGYVDIPSIVRETVLSVGYDDAAKGFDGKSCGVSVCIGKQSPDIARGVNEEADGKKKEQGAGDQGMMFGFACKETKSFMPLPIDLAHRLVKKQAEVRFKNQIKGLRPDAKSQVTVEYEGLTPVRIETVVLSTQHGPEWNGAKKQKELREQVIEKIIKPVLGKWWHEKIKVFVNPTGQFVVGGPHGDCGLTGRKIIVDTYGGRGAVTAAARSAARTRRRSIVRPPTWPVTSRRTSSRPTSPTSAKCSSPTRSASRADLGPRRHPGHGQDPR